MKTVDEIVSAMSLDEKIALIAGKNFWQMEGVPSAGLKPVMLTDGPHGLRKQAAAADHLGLNESVPSTCFPPACLMASSWDAEVTGNVGKAMGEECVAEEVSIILGPGVNIKRSPLCGRNFEYYSEDPYLAGKLAAGLIRGVESKGIGTSLKHFAANNQERFRLAGNSVVDERALREIYLKPFEIAVREGKPSTVMCSYNRINNVYSAVNRWLLTDVLREEWGFDGFVMTDWGAMSDRVEAVKAGLDLEMPGPAKENAAKVRAAIENGSLSMDDLDTCVRRLVSFILKAEKVEKKAYSIDAHHKIARDAAASSFVLLENDGTLPLKKDGSYALIGSLAEHIRYQGAGSSKINPNRLDTIRDFFPHCSYAEGYDPVTGETSDIMIADAVAACSGKTAAIVVIGLSDSYESEGFDRTSMDLPQGHVKLVGALLDKGIPVIAVLLSGAPVTLPFRHRVNAMLLCYLGGEALGSALESVLTGRMNPSGKLPETFPVRLEDNPSYGNFASDDRNVLYKESIFVGYRWYDYKNLPVAYEFGYGLSYTDFEYSRLSISSDAVSFTVKNTGECAGDEVVQLYTGLPSSRIVRPVRELRGFEKIHLEAGEEKQVVLPLNRDCFTYYDVVTKSFEVEEGEYEISIGASSRDLRLKGLLHVDGTREPHVRGNIADFASLFDGSLPLIEETGCIDMNTTVADALKTPGGKEVLGPVARMMDETYSGDDTVSRMMKAMVYEMPIRGLWMSQVENFSVDDTLKRINDINSRK